MNTELFGAEGAARAGNLVRSGALAVFPTETVYGLGADAFNPAACKRIFEAKGRPQDNPLITHIYDRSQVDLLARELPPGAEILMDAFWPGPLTLVLPKKPAVSDVVTAGLDTVGVRMPDHPVALEFLRAAGNPVAAPSANRSGRPSPTTFAMARDAMEGRIEAILDGGPCETGLESTVAAWSETPSARGWTILRPGAVTREDLFSVLDDLFIRETEVKDQSLLARSPGTRHPHYRPNAEVRLFSAMQELEAEQLALAAGWAVIALDDAGTAPGAGTAPRAQPIERRYPVWIDLARRLYVDFSELDALGVPGIFVQAPAARADLATGGTTTGGIAEALLNRLLKASAGTWAGER
jgi:L-threonylcarbamoyladenylate synthase